VDHLRQRIGGAGVGILEDIALDVIDRQDEVVTAAFGFGLQEFLQFVPAGFAGKVVLTSINGRAMLGDWHGDSRRDADRTDGG
jgi:hypothetical protein